MSGFKFIYQTGTGPGQRSIKMRKLLLVTSLAVMSLGSPGRGQAHDYYYYEWGPWWGPANGSDAAYWPHYRASAWGARDQACVRWNWQQLSYYDYCGRYGHSARRHRDDVLRARD